MIRALWRDAIGWQHRERFCRRNGHTVTERARPTACSVCGVTIGFHDR